MCLKNRIAMHEGFSPVPYIDPLVKQHPEKHGIQPTDLQVAEKILNKLKLTFGFGFTFITREEALAVLQIRINKISQRLSSVLPFYNGLTQDVKDALIEMAFQLGVEGVLEFKNMLKAIEERDWCAAYKEGLNSKWYKETPHRAIAVLKPFKDNCEQCEDCKKQRLEGL